MSFGQINYSSKQSVQYYLEENPPKSNIEGVWESKYGLGYVINVDDKYYMIGLGFYKDEFIFTSYLNSRVPYSNAHKIISKLYAGDTLGVFEQSSKNKYFYKGLELSYTNLQRVPKKYHKSRIKALVDRKFVGKVDGFKSKFDVDVYEKYVEKEVFITNSEDYENTIYMQAARPFFKEIPKHQEINKYNNIKSSEWLGNGSGIIVSKNGYIVTNNHVIEEANEIEVELILNGELQKFNAEVVQKDIRNDLAIIKIVDINFDGLAAINYNFKSRSSDVGTKIYTYGYPKALTGMGKEIKITEGIISSKSGVMGDITTYQITAPIQGGNSGGPLFDEKANLIGINSSKFNSENTENVNYSIKSSYVMNLIDVLPKSIDLPSSTKLQSLPLTQQIKEISKYVVLIKVK
jgi:S1-C subfamily serine protease